MRAKPETDGHVVPQFLRLLAVPRDPGASLESPGLFRAGARVLYA
jgi:hypothetical protein